MICRIKPKWLLFGTALLFYHTLVKAQDEGSTAAPAIRTFSTQADVSGAATNNVNLFTGDVAFPLKLVSLPGHNGLSVDVALAYSSNVDKDVNLWNLEAPFGTTGLGWSMDVPKVIADYKQTGAREDDEYYLSMNGTTSKLVRTTYGTDDIGAYYAYETKDYQFWKIRFYYDIAEITNSGANGSGPNKWIVTTDDGTQYVYGDKNSGRKTVQWAVRWSNWMGNSAQTLGQSQMAIAWNLSEVVNVWKEKIIYEYEQVEQQVGSTAGLTHTEACYLKQITDVMGRKVQFFYNEKDPKFYMEPHTEQAEPDAYQEQYEKKYLDHVSVLKEDGSLFLSVQLQYTDLNPNSTNGTAKMLLTSIVEKNAKGRNLPGMSFEYYQTGTVGYLKKITYPTGGSVTYTYTGQQLPGSDRQRTIQAPWGYAEPKVWLGEDYVVVAWRQLNSDDTHSTASQSVALYVYTWVGEWKEQYIGQTGTVELEGQPAFRDYKDYEVTIQKDFFGVLVRNALSGNHSLFLVSKSNWVRGEWNTNRYDNVYGGDPTLLSGTNFVLVGSENDAVNHPSQVFNFTGDSWTPIQLSQSSGDYNYTAANNYFITHRRVFTGTWNAEINFNYFTEDRKIVSKRLGTDLEFISSGKSYWHSGNSMAIAMANDNPEFAYLWDVTYSNFFKDATDINGNALFGAVSDNAPVFLVNNSLVGMFGRLARYDGWWWHTDNISSLSSLTDNYFSYGDDYVVRPTTYSNNNYGNGGRKVFDPNTLQWLPDVAMSGESAGWDVANAGIDHYYFGRGYWYRKPTGVWENKVLYDIPNDRLISLGGYPKLDVLVGSSPFPVEKINVFKNGNYSEFFMGDQNLLYKTTKFKSNGLGNSTIVTYPKTFSTSVFNTVEDAYVIKLTRLVSDDIIGPQLDFPVSLVTINDGTQNRYTSITYNAANGRFDASGNSALYHEVTVIPGSDNPVSRPFGYTTTYFNNGLTTAELGTTDPFQFYTNWMGAPYETKVYNSNDQLVSSNRTEYWIFTKDLLNNDGNLVYKARYIRPTTISSTKDGVYTSTINTYDANTGQLRISSTSDHNSKDHELITTYKYFWEQYDPTRSANILSPIIQTTKSVKTPGAGQVAFDVLAVTWKPWNNVFAPYKTYQWKRSGSSDFDFTNWSGTGEPAADWLKLSQIDVRDVNGNVIRETKR